MQNEDVWAERMLEFVEKDQASRIPVRLGRPFTKPGMSGAWRVNIEIYDITGQILNTCVAGEDPIHCLQLALLRVHALLEPWRHRGRLTYNGNDDLGFPWFRHDSARLDGG